MVRKRKIEITEYNNIKNYYLNDKLNHREIGILYNVVPSLICQILKSLNVSGRKYGNGKYTHDKNYFKTINTIKKAYFLGFIVADGNVFKNRFSMNLQQRDSYILEKLKKDIQYTGPLTFKKRYLPHYQDAKNLVIESKDIVSDLAKYGVVPRKSLISYFPNIPKEFFSHFIRGIFDGDGTCNKNPSGQMLFSIVGTFELLNSIQDILVENCNLNKNRIIKEKNKQIFILSYAGNHITKRIFDYIYKDCDDFFLTRKYEKFDFSHKNKRVYNEYTNIKMLPWQKYRLIINHKDYGTHKTLEEALFIRDKIKSEYNIIRKKEGKSYNPNLIIASINSENLVPITAELDTVEF